jgi:starvation-inducible DNA-binding protein
MAVGRRQPGVDHPDDVQMTARMRETHALCDEHGDVASASLLENWIDEAEGRAWFLYEATRRA